MTEENWAVPATSSKKFTGTNASGNLEVRDPTTTVNNVNVIDFTSGATVTSGGAGIANVEITGGGGGGGVTSLSMGTTGLTPAAATTGAITVGGTLVVGHGGTGATTLTTNGVLIGNGVSPVSAVDLSTKGSILVGNGAGNPVALPVGLDTYVLTADAAEPTGIKWAASAGGAFTLTGDSGTNQSIAAGDTMDIAGGTGLSTVVGAPDTLTVNLDNTAVTPGSYTYSSITVDAQGRLTAASSGAAPGTMSSWEADGDAGVNFTVSDGDVVDFDGDQGISTQTLAATKRVLIQLDNTAVTPGSYTYGSFTVDQQGRLTAASSGAAPGTMSSWILSDGLNTQTVNDGNTVTVTGGTGLTSTVSAVDTVTLVLDDTAVAPGSYGSATDVGTFTVDAQGRLTAASNQPITYPFTTFDIATDPATAIEPVNDGETITFQAGTFITPTVSPPRTILSDLSATGTPDATKFLRGDNSWATPAGGGTMSTWDLAGDSGPSQTVSDTDTVTVAGGTGLSSVASATDTVTLNLDNTAVAPASYGSATEVGTFTVDAQGRLTAAANQAISFPSETFTLTADSGSNQTIGDGDTMDVAGGTAISTVVGATDTVTVNLDDTVVTPGSYTYASLTVDQQGRLTAASSGASPGTMSSFTLTADSGSNQTIADGNTMDVAGGTGLSTVVSATDTVTVNIDDTTVTPGSYTYSSITVDQQGRLTSASSGAAPGTMSSFEVAADSGPAQSIADANTLTLAGGTGLSSVASATDTVTYSIDDTTVTPGSYTYSSITVDQQGRLTAASSGAAPGTMSSWILSDGSNTQTVADGNTVTVTGGTGLTSTVSATDTVTLVLDDTVVTPGSYTYGSFTVDQQGRLTAASSGSAPIVSFTLAGDGGASQTISNGDTLTVAGGTGLTTTASATDTVTVALDNTAVTAGSYGSATQVGTFTVDDQGRLTAASNVSIAYPSESFTLTADSGSNQTIGDGDTMDIAGGTAISTVVGATDTVTVNLDNTAVTPGSYTYTSLTVDQQGRLTAASSGSGPDISGSIATGQIAYGASANTIAGTNNLYWDNSNTRMSIGGDTTPDAMLHLKSAVSAQPEIRLENTNADNQEACIRFMKNTSSPASGDDIGLIRFEGENSAGGNHLYSYIMAQMLDPTDTQESGEMIFYVGHKGAQLRVFEITGSNTGTGEIVCNEGGNDDFNFRVESDTQTHMLFVDAADNRVGIANSNPTVALDVTGEALITGTSSPVLGVNGGTVNNLAIFESTDATARISFKDNSTSGDTHVGLGAVGNDLTLYAGNQANVTLQSGGNVSFEAGKLDTYDGSAPTAGQLLIGDATAGVWDAATLTAGSNVTITNADGAITIAASGGGGGGAPTDAEYVVLSANGTLTDERVLTAGTAISLTDGGAGSTITVANTGVTSNVAGTGIGVSGATGAVTISNTGVLQVGPAPSATNVVFTAATGNVGIDILNQTTPGLGDGTGRIDGLIDIGAGPQPIAQVAWIMFEETSLGLGNTYIPIFQP
jgi:hypothetical protein